VVTADFGPEIELTQDLNMLVGYFNVLRPLVIYLGHSFSFEHLIHLD